MDWAEKQQSITEKLVFERLTLDMNTTPELRGRGAGSRPPSEDKTVSSTYCQHWLNTLTSCRTCGVNALQASPELRVGPRAFQTLYPRTATVKMGHGTSASRPRPRVCARPTWKRKVLADDGLIRDEEIVKVLAEAPQAENHPSGRCRSGCRLFIYLA